MRRLQRWEAWLALNTATVLWGAQHAVNKHMLVFTSPSALLAARFVLAATAVLPWLPLSRARNSWLDGVKLGLWSTLGFAFQMVGLQYTSASRSSFLLYLNVKLVPLLELMVHGHMPSLQTWAAAAVALLGALLLAFDGGAPNLGDLWSLVAATTSACFIITLGSASRSEGAVAAELNATTAACTAALCSVWAVADAATSTTGSALHDLLQLQAHIAEVAFLGVVTTAFAQWLQALGQARIDATDAAVIFALDPVYGVCFASLWLGEHLGPQGLLGAGCILLANLSQYACFARRTAASAQAESDAELPLSQKLLVDE